jgi:hypothetical protein
LSSEYDDDDDDCLELFDAHSQPLWSATNLEIVVVELQTTTATGGASNNMVISICLTSFSQKQD